MEAEFRAPKLDHHQLLVDIGLAKSELRRVLETVDYSNLDENPLFVGINTTTEYVAFHIHGLLAAACVDGRLGHGGPCRHMVKAALCEAPTAWAAFEGPLTQGKHDTAGTVEDKGLISIVRINRPERLNAINQDVAVEMQQAFKAFDADDSKRVAVAEQRRRPRVQLGRRVSNLPELWRAIPTVGYNTEKPIIAATTGWVIGGAIVMVMMCDLMVSTESTTFYYPEAKLGTTAGGISSLVTRMPHKLAMEIMLLGCKVPAQRAYDVGFVNRVVRTASMRRRRWRWRNCWNPLRW